MPEPRTPRARRFLRWRIVLPLLIVAAVGGGLGVRWLLRPEHLSAALIAATRSTLNAELAIDGRAHYTLWPKLHLVLPHPTLRTSTSALMFRAESLDVLVPWQVLWSDHYDVERIELIRPTLDVDVLSAWFDAQPAQNVKPPQVSFSLHIENGALVRGPEPVIQNVNVDLASAGDVVEWLEQWRASVRTDVMIPPLVGNVDVSHVRAGSVELEGVHIEVRESATNPAHKP